MLSPNANLFFSSFLFFGTKMEVFYLINSFPKDMGSFND